MSGSGIVRCFGIVVAWGALTLNAQAAEVPLPKPLPALKAPATARVELGQMLFFDRRLSGDGTMSCAVCHNPEQAYGDGRALSGAYPTNKHWRNSQSLLNLAYLQNFFWDGRSDSLESQAQEPIHSSFEMNLNLDFLVEKLREIPEYRDRFRNAFDREVDRAAITAALADFQRTLVVRDTPFDRFLGGDKQALDGAAQRGLTLFYGKAGCARCHAGSLLSDQKFHNLGIAETPELLNDPQRRATRHFFQRQMGLERMDRDPGRFAVSRNPVELGAFRTPPLRQIAQTGPYQHNGSLATLADVIAFYNQGGGSQSGKSALLAPLNLTTQESSELLAFLHSLSGTVPVVKAPPLP